MTKLDLDFDTADLDRLIAATQMAGPIVAGEMRATMDASVDLAQQQVRGNTPTGATGNLLQSIARDVFGTPLSLTGRVTTAAVYGEPVEFGRKPGSMPPVEQTGLELWVRRKLGVPPNEVESVAYAIAISIKRKGTQGKFMFKKGFEASKPIIKKQWSDLPTRVVAKMEAKL